MKKAIALGLLALLAIALPTGGEPTETEHDEQDPPKGTCILLTPGRIPPLVVDPPYCLPKKDG
jgi:hypothetical protein